MREEISDEDLLELVERIDMKLFAAGVPVTQRSLGVAREACQQLGSSFQLGVGSNALSKRVREAFSKLYRKRDIGAPSMHSGISAHMDCFARIDFPIIFGTVKIDPMTHTDLTPIQLQRMYRYEGLWKSFLDDICDVYDIGFCLSQIATYEKVNDDAKAYFRMACFNSQAATATMIQNFSLQGSLQAALISAELSIKSLLLSLGMPMESVRKEVGHNLRKAIRHLRTLDPSELEKLNELIERLPDLVTARYSTSPTGRMPTYKIVRDCQEVVAIVARDYSGESMRDQLQSG